MSPKFQCNLNIIGKNIIAASKKQNHYGAILLLIFQYYNTNIGFFSTASCKVIALNLLCLIFSIMSLLLSFSIVFALPIIVIAMFVVHNYPYRKAKNDHFCYPDIGKFNIFVGP